MIDPGVFLQDMRHLDGRQREAVLCDRNCVVTAGAGSGKTTVLSYRFLRLVVEGKAHADEILTLTFSRMAAAEMHERIHAQLTAYRMDSDLAGELRRFGNATITTIDAFCNRIVGADATRYGIGPDFTLDEQSNRIMARECAEEILDTYQNHPGVLFLASVYSPDELADSLFVDMACSVFHPSGSFDAASAAQAVLGRIRDIHRNSLELCLQACSGIAALDGTGKVFERDLLAARTMLAGKNELERPEDAVAALTFLESLSMAACRGKGTFVEECNGYVSSWKKAHRLLCSSCAALADQDTLFAVYTVLAAYRDLYLERKRAAGILTFSDVAHMAVDILKNNREVRAQYRDRFRYIMVDEFQDTNGLQKDLLYLLAEDPKRPSEGIPTADGLQADKLFFVGDEKQSIYRFRGADVRVFKLLDREIVRSGGAGIVLDTNYRSEPQLIETFNRMFPSIMGTGGALFEADFQQLKAREASEGIASTVSFLFKPMPGGEEVSSEPEEEEEAVESVQAEAYALARLIRRMVDGDGHLIRDSFGQVRRPSYRDIAILYRTSSNQLHYEKALRIAGIPYTLSAVQSLFLEAPANDIYLMLQLVVYPSDRLAFAGVLRSPFCRLADDAVLAVLDSMADGADAFPSIDRIPLPETERRRYERSRSLYSRLCVLARTATVAQAISFLWYEGGYRYHLLSDRTYQVYLEHFDFILELGKRFDSRDEGLPMFLDYLRPRLGQNEKLSDVEPLRDDVDGVRLMTIHRSKGLEFPIVILAGMGTMTRPGTTPPWYAVEDIAGGLPVPIHMHPHAGVKNLLYEADKETLRAMETAEMKRLFYVAVTRAKFHLVLSGCFNRQNMGAEAHDRNFLALFLRHTAVLDNPSMLGDRFGIYTIKDAPVSVLRPHVPRPLIEKTVGIMLSRYRENPPPGRIAQRRSFGVTELVRADARDSGYAETEVYPALPPVEADALVTEHGLSAAFGTWCHAVLERTIGALTAPYGTVGSVPVADPRECMPREFFMAGFTEKQLAIIRRSVAELVGNFTRSELFSFLCNSKPLSMECEVAFACRRKLEGRDIAVYGSIDLLIIYSGEVRVVDFKTDSVRFPRIHGEQLHMYREAAFRLYGLPVLSTLCYLRSPGNEVWDGAFREDSEQRL